MPFRYCSINSINVDVAVEYIQSFFQISTVSLSILGLNGTNFNPSYLQLSSIPTTQLSVLLPIIA